MYIDEPLSRRHFLNITSLLAASTTLSCCATPVVTANIGTTSITGVSGTIGFGLITNALYDLLKGGASSILSFLSDDDKNDIRRAAIRCGANPNTCIEISGVVGKDIIITSLKKGDVIWAQRNIDVVFTDQLYVRINNPTDASIHGQFVFEIADATSGNIDHALYGHPFTAYARTSSTLVRPIDTRCLAFRTPGKKVIRIANPPAELNSEIASANALVLPISMHYKS